MKTKTVDLGPQVSAILRAAAVDLTCASDGSWRRQDVCLRYLHQLVELGRAGEPDYEPALESLCNMFMRFQEPQPWRDTHIQFLQMLRDTERHSEWLSYVQTWPNPLVPNRTEANPLPRFLKALERVSELLATNPPGSWLNRALGGPGKDEHHG